MIEEILKDMQAVENLTNKFCEKLHNAVIHEQDPTRIIRSINCLNLIYELLYVSLLKQN